jgi:hypothetical protein
MADKQVERVVVRSDIPEASVHVDDKQRLQVEFRIDDLVRRLIPGAGVASHCSGCHGCSGCSM